MGQGLQTVIERFSVGSVYVTDDTFLAISERLKLHDLPVAIVQPPAAVPSSQVPEEVAPQVPVSVTVAVHVEPLLTLLAVSDGSSVPPPAASTVTVALAEPVRPPESVTEAVPDVYLQEGSADRVPCTKEADRVPCTKEIAGGIGPFEVPGRTSNLSVGRRSSGLDRGAVHQRSCHPGAEGALPRVHREHRANTRGFRHRLHPRPTGRTHRTLCTSPAIGHRKATPCRGALQYTNPGSTSQQ